MKTSTSVNSNHRYDAQKVKLRSLVTEFGDLILDMSQTLESKYHRLSDDPSIKNPDDPHELAGFIAKEHAETGVSILADVHAVSLDRGPTLRLGVIQLTNDNGNEVFNSISFFFLVDADVALQTAKKAENITRDDLRKVLHNESTRLEGMFMSNQSGVDVKSDKRFGESYSLDTLDSEAEFNKAGELLQDNRTGNAISVDNIEKVIREDIYPRLKAAVQAETESSVKSSEIEPLSV